jgi:hypothetical protein
MNGRSVLLLRDNFSAHQSALQSVKLKNVKVVFLPPNTTSVSQPCDQGIIHALKCYYRRTYIRWCLEKWEEKKSSVQEINLLRAIRWIMSSWEMEVTGETLANCFLKSRVMNSIKEESLDMEVGLMSGSGHAWEWRRKSYFHATHKLILIGVLHRCAPLSISWQQLSFC